MSQNASMGFKDACSRSSCWPVARGETNFKKFLCDQVKRRSLGQEPPIGLQRVPNGFAHKIAGPSRLIIVVQHKPCRSAVYFLKS